MNKTEAYKEYFKELKRDREARRAIWLKQPENQNKYRELLASNPEEDPFAKSDEFWEAIEYLTLDEIDDAPELPSRYYKKTSAISE